MPVSPLSPELAALVARQLPPERARLFTGLNLLQLRRVGRPARAADVDPESVMTAAQLAASPAHFAALAERQLPCCDEISRAAAAGRNFLALEHYRPQMRPSHFAAVAREAVSLQCRALVQWAIVHAAALGGASVFKLWGDAALCAVAAGWQRGAEFLLNCAPQYWITRSAAGLCAQACAHAQLAVVEWLAAEGFAVDWSSGYAAAAEEQRIAVLDWLWARYPLEPDELEDLYWSARASTAHCRGAGSAGALPVLDWLWGRGARRPELVLCNALADNSAASAQWALARGASYFDALRELAENGVLDKTLTVAGALWDPAQHSAGALVAIGLDRGCAGVLEWCVRFCPGAAQPGN